MLTDELAFLLFGVALGGTAVMVVDCIRGDRSHNRDEDRASATQEFYEDADQAVEVVSDHPPTDAEIDDGETQDVIARRANLHVVNGTGGPR